MELPALLRLLLFLLVLLARQPMATVDGELNTNSSSYTVPEGVCFRIWRSVEGGTAVSLVSAHRIGHSCPHVTQQTRRECKLPLCSTHVGRA